MLISSEFQRFLTFSKNAAVDQWKLHSGAPEMYQYTQYITLSQENELTQ